MQMSNQWLDKAEYPFTSRYFCVNEHNLHYIDEGLGPVILFVHGTPSWSFDFRNIIKSLSLNFRCVALDHIGFGLSDKPTRYDYSTENHSRTLRHFIEHLKLEQFTLVVHDFGGPIGLSAAMEMPDRLARIVVMNSWFWSSRGKPEFERFSKILRSPFLPFLYKYFNFSPRFVMPASFGNRKLSKQLRMQYTSPFAIRNERNGPLAFVNSLLNDQEWFEELWYARQPIADKEVLLIWGMNDPVVGPGYLEKFGAGFRNVSAKKLEGCGHFPQEEHPMEVANYIKEFIEFGLPTRMTSSLP
jgi:pimeloyl-ACP methyl ester carboxylesterase